MSLQVDNSDFHVDKTITAAPGSGTEPSVEVTFEPSRIGEPPGHADGDLAHRRGVHLPAVRNVRAPETPGPLRREGRLDHAHHVPQRVLEHDAIHLPGGQPAVPPHQAGRVDSLAERPPRGRRL